METDPRQTELITTKDRSSDNDVAPNITITATSPFLVGCICYVQQDDAPEAVSKALSAIAVLLDSLRGAVIVTHPHAWVTDLHGQQGAGSATFIFGRWEHRRILKEFFKDLEEVRHVNTIMFVVG